MRKYFGRLTLAAVTAGILGGCPIQEENFTPRTSYTMMKEEDRSLFSYVDPYYSFPEGERPRSYIGPVNSISLSNDEVLTYIEGNTFVYDPDIFTDGDEIRFSLKEGESFWERIDRKFRLCKVLEEDVSSSEKDKKIRKAIIVEDVWE